MNKTALQQMIEKIEQHAWMVNEPNPINYPAFLSAIAHDLKKVEREQIEEAYGLGIWDGKLTNEILDGTDYYTKTYEQ
jgi:hypothetical protein